MPVRCLAIALTLLLTSPLPSLAGGAEPEVCELAPPLQLRLPASLEARRQDYDAWINAAVTTVVTRFGDWGYPLCAGDLIDKAVVFETPEAARQAVAAHFDLAADQVPAHFSGTVDGTTLFVASRPMFQRTWPEAHPETPWTDDQYQALLVHELAHRAHALVATSLFGSEAGMGPRWFFEGLAVQAAGQFAAETATPLKTAELQAWAREPKGLRYAQYGRMVGTLAGRMPIKELIRRAGEKDFEKSLTL